MSDLKGIAHRMYDEVISGGRLELLDEMIHDDFVEHEVAPGMPSDKEAPRAFVTTFRAAFPDLKATIEDMLQEGDRLVIRARCTGTHEGEFMGIPPTGRSVDFGWFDMVRFEDGKAIEHWGVTDSMTMMQQLGVIPDDAPG